MKFTNRLGLPAPIALAVVNDPYDSGGADISVTRLITPPQIVALKKAHEAELEEDVADRIYSLFGQITHGILERAAAAKRDELSEYGKVIYDQIQAEGGLRDIIAERRYFVERLGWKVSGQIDVYFPHQQLLQDYKFVSVYKMMDGVPIEYEQQFNLNAVLLRAAGLPVTRAEVIVLYRDWSKTQAERSSAGDYPQTQVQKFVVPLWKPEQQEAFLLERVRLHQEAQAGNPAACSPADCWERPTAYAVMRRGRARAVRLCATEAEAWQLVGNDPQLYVQMRPGRRVRCESYCPVSQFCKQWRTWCAQNGGKHE